MSDVQSCLPLQVWDLRTTVEIRDRARPFHWEDDDGCHRRCQRVQSGFYLFNMPKERLPFFLFYILFTAVLTIKKKVSGLI